MDSFQMGFQRMRRMASSNARVQQISQRNLTDPTRAMVVLNYRANTTKISFKALQSAAKLLGTLIDEMA
jgi:hypothetical protein